LGLSYSPLDLSFQKVSWSEEVGMTADLLYDWLLLQQPLVMFECSSELLL
jgi:hypothetical protein